MLPKPGMPPFEKLFLDAPPLEAADVIIVGEYRRGFSSSGFQMCMAFFSSRTGVMPRLKAAGYRKADSRTRQESADGAPRPVFWQDIGRAAQSNRPFQGFPSKLDRAVPGSTAVFRGVEDVGQNGAGRCGALPYFPVAAGGDARSKRQGRCCPEFRGLRAGACSPASPRGLGLMTEPNNAAAMTLPVGWRWRQHYCLGATAPRLVGQPLGRAFISRVFARRREAPSRVYAL